MPFYEYQCAACKAHHEELQRVTARPLRKCPACGKSTLRRLVSAPAFRLKGGGWYETDFKADKDNQRNIAGDKAPPVEKPKEDKATAATTASPPKSDEASKPAPVAEKSKPRGNTPAPARKTRTRRRVRK